MPRWKTALWLGTAAALFALALATFAIAARSGAGGPDCAAPFPDYAGRPLHPGYGPFRIAPRGAVRPRQYSSQPGKARRAARPPTGPAGGRPEDRLRPEREARGTAVSENNNTEGRAVAGRGDAERRGAADPSDTDRRAVAGPSSPTARAPGRALPPGCAHADEVMLDYAVRFGADRVRFLDRAQTQRYWDVFNREPPPTLFGSDNLIVAGGEFIVPVLHDVACRAIRIRVPELHRRAMERAINGEPSL